MIKRLVLKNYRVYDELDMSFEDLQVIKGRNGTGKTSIVEAIGFAMFGSTLQRGKAASWIKEGEKDGSVTLYLDDYVITRSNTLAIVEDINGNIVAKNNTGITEWIEVTYGLTADLYRTSFYIGQKDIGAFAALSPLERTKRVEKLLRIDRLDEIKTLIKEKARAVSGNLDLYTSKLENSPFNKELLETHQNTLQEGKDKLESLNELYEEGLVKLGEYKQAIAIWRDKQNLQTQFRGISYDLDTLEEEYKEHLEKNASVDSHNKLAREKTTLERNLASVTILEEYFNSDIRDIMNHEKDLKTFKKLKTELDNLNCKAKNHDLDKMKDKITEKQNIYDLNKDIPEDCPTCKQPWPEKTDIDIDKLLEEIVLLKEKYISAKEEHRAFEIEQELVEPKMTEEQIEAAVVSITNKDKYLRLKELEDVSTDILKTEAFHTDIEVARKQKSIELRLQEMEDIVEPEEVDLTELRSTISTLKTKLSESDEIIARELRYKAVQEEFSVLHSEASELLQEFKDFIKFIDQYRKAFGSNVIPLLEENVSSIVNYLSEGKYDSVKINPDYGVENFEYYSGSEQDSINFALRLAIAQVSKLGGFNTMLLDEIAASFDTQREQLLMDILKQQSNQLIYITHGEL